MHLHPRLAVDAAYAANAEALSIVNGALEESIQEVAGRWEDRYPNLPDMFAGALPNNVRLTFRQIAPDRLIQSTLTHEEGNFGGQRLCDKQGRKFRVRKRPTTDLTVASSFDTDLFGGQVVAVNYELMVLWSVNLELKVLAEASLAAVSKIDDPENVCIHYERLLPEPQLGSASPGRIDSHDEDFGDEDFGDETGASGVDL